MRFCCIFWVAFSSFHYLLMAGCSAENQAENQPDTQQATAVSTTETPATAQALGATAESPKPAPAAQLSTPPKATSAPLGGPKKKPAFAKLGRPKTPAASGAGSNTPDRAAEVKRLIDAYQNMAVRYTDSLILAQTPEEKAAATRREPGPRSVRTFARGLIRLVAADPKDTPALDALVFLCRFLGTPEVDQLLADAAVAPDTDSTTSTKLDPLALLLEYHASDPKIIDALRRLPRGDMTDTFLHALFEKTFSPKVRWAAGAQLIASLRRNNRPQEMKEIVITMSEDRYLEGVPVGRYLNARTWSINKLREIRLLAIGKVLPEVSGEKLEGGTGQITDYRGKVVVLDVWTTWCGPCNRMIPHQREMVERFSGEPFALLSVSCDRDQETLETFLTQTPMPWDHWWVAPDSQFKKALNISSFPTIFVLDGNGVIRYKNLMGAQLEEAIETLLAENEQPAAAPQN